MANIKSQIKRNRQNDKKRLRNRTYRGESRIAVKNVRNLMEEGSVDSKAALQEAIKKLDKAVERGVIHKNNAARKKSHLVKAFSKLAPVQEAAPAEVQKVAEKPVEAKRTRKTDAAEKAASVEAKKAETTPRKADVKKAVTKKKEPAARAAKNTTSRKATSTKKPAADK